jgi:hypothetical protein
MIEWSGELCGTTPKTVCVMSGVYHVKLMLVVSVRSS